uniref:Uncharacterized protein n=1 Tax=Clandestinovirus TaxID=2831644 RepID=A0A8F8KLS8_9VIRU|nr:hypothetical protein KOM_12_481 [Clandestinovirus]
MLLYCNSSSGYSFLMKHAPIQWLNVWKAKIVSPSDRKDERYTLFNYSSHNLCPTQKDTWIHIVGHPLDCRQSIAQLFGSDVGSLHTRDKATVKMMTDKKQILDTLVSVWSQVDIDDPLLKKEVGHIMTFSSDLNALTTWVEQAYDNQLTNPTSIRGRIANAMNGDSRVIVDILTVLLAGQLAEDAKVPVVSSVTFEPWIMDLLKEDTTVNLVDEKPEWLKPKKKDESKETQMVEINPEYSIEVQNADKIVVWEVLQQIKGKHLTAEDRWKAYISLHLLFDVLADDEDNIARTRSALKSLAKGLPVHSILHIVAKWLNSSDEEPLAPKQLELILSEVHRMISEEPVRELNMRLLFLPWLIPPFLKSSLPHQQKIWERLHLKTFDMFGMIYGKPSLR